jgi:hypothetical protein
LAAATAGLNTGERHNSGVTSIRSWKTKTLEQQQNRLKPDRRNNRIMLQKETAPTRRGFFYFFQQFW